MSRTLSAILRYDVIVRPVVHSERENPSGTQPWRYVDARRNVVDLRVVDGDTVARTFFAP
jgi:hypothetical protein